MARTRELLRNSLLVPAALFLILYILPLGLRPMTMPDEFRYGEIPREMIASGDWVVPRLNNLRYFEKPVLGYWLNALSMLLFGDNAFAIRLPSALSTGLSSLMVFFLMGGTALGRASGSMASAGLLICPLVFALGTLSLLDGMLSMFLTLGMGLFFFAYKGSKPMRRTLISALSGVCFGMAFLIKGFLAFALPVVSLAPFLIWERQWKRVFPLTIVPISSAILVSLPWALMIHQREPDYWHYFFYTEHISRFLSPLRGQHPEPFWYLVPVLLAGALPWIPLIPMSLKGLKTLLPFSPLLRYALCWFFFPFLFFSLCKGKLIPYILPCFPPLMILITAGIMAAYEKGENAVFKSAAVFLALTLGLVTMVLVLGQVTDIQGLSFYGPYETWKWLVAILGLGVWIGLLLLSVKRTGKEILFYGLAPSLLLLFSHGIIPHGVIADKTPQGFLLKNHDRIVRADTLISQDHLVHALCWTFKRDDVFLLEHAGELRYGLAYDEAKGRIFPSVGELRLFIETHARKGSVVLVLGVEEYDKYRASLPRPLFEDIGPYFALAQY